jgi:hypothetical protein
MPLQESQGGIGARRDMHRRRERLLRQCLGEQFAMPVRLAK